MSRYAAGTSVAADQSRAEVERSLVRYGATAFAYGWMGARASLQFEIRGRRMRFSIPMPDRSDRAFRFTPQTGKPRSEASAEEAYQQAVRQRWRAVALLVKAQLEAVTAGIITIEDAFLAQTVLPGGQTVAEMAAEPIAIAYQTGHMPPLLPGPGHA